MVFGDDRCTHATESGILTAFLSLASHSKGQESSPPVCEAVGPKSPMFR